MNRVQRAALIIPSSHHLIITQSQAPHSGRVTGTMKTNSRPLLLIAGILLAAGCSATQPGVQGDAAPLAPGVVLPAADQSISPLEEYRQALENLQEQRRQNESLARELVQLRQTVGELYERLAIEQQLRYEAELAAQALKNAASASSTSKEAVDRLRAELERTKTDLAAAQDEVKARREELMRIILEQQKWNKFVLDRIKPASP